MKKEKREESYLETMIDYQDKRSLGGYYTGGRLDPMYKAKTKAGGYFLLLGGIFSICVYSLLLLLDFKLENIAIAIIVITASILSIIVGIKFIKFNSRE